MNAKDFRNLINRGLGSTILFLKENQNRNRKYLKAIQYACTNNTAYDPQVEGSRAEYLWEAIQYSGYSEYLQEAVLTSLLASTQPYDIEQMLHLSRRFAENGNNSAKEIMYKTFQYNEHWNTFIGADDLILLDGTHGLLFVADAIGKKILSDNYYEDDWILSIAEEELGKDNVRICLTEGSRTNPNVKAYIDSVNSFVEKEAPRAKEKVKTYEEIKLQIDDINDKTNNFKYSYWGAHATEQDFLKAAQDFLVENNRNKIIKYLNIFSRKQFRLNVDKIVTLAYSKDKTIFSNAIGVLKKIRNEQVHELAISLWSKNPRCYPVIELLEKNYHDTDYQILQEVLFQKHNKYMFHHLGMSILEIAEEHSSSNCTDLLVHIYNLTWCSNCRRRAVETMIKTEIAPDWVLKECEFDSNPDIRELINNSSPI
jgi:hypothetical protein